MPVMIQELFLRQSRSWPGPRWGDSESKIYLSSNHIIYTETLEMSAHQEFELEFLEMFRVVSQLSQGKLQGKLKKNYTGRKAVTPFKDEQSI